jgi:hypothetical protein
MALAMEIQTPAGQFYPFHSEGNSTNPRLPYFCCQNSRRAWGSIDELSSQHNLEVFQIPIAPEFGGDIFEIFRVSEKLRGSLRAIATDSADQHYGLIRFGILKTRDDGIVATQIRIDGILIDDPIILLVLSVVRDLNFPVFDLVELVTKRLHRTLRPSVIECTNKYGRTLLKIGESRFGA